MCRMVEDSGTGWYRMIFVNHSTSHMRASFCCFSSFSGQHSKVSLAPTTSTRAGIQKVTTRWRSIPEVCAGKGELVKSHFSDNSDNNLCITSEWSAFVPAFKKIYVQGGMDIYMTDPSITSSSSSARKCPRTRQAKFLQLWWAEFHQISLNTFEPIWLYKYYTDYIICQNSVEVLICCGILFDSFWMFSTPVVIGAGLQPVDQGGAAHGHLGVASLWAHRSSDASNHRKLSALDAKSLWYSLRKKMIKWYKVEQDLSGDEARYNSEMDGCTWMHPLCGSFWNKETESTPLDYPKLTRLHSSSRQMAGKEYWGI